MTLVEPHITERPEDYDTLNALALAMVQHPRASLQELAKAIGVSKATLYRFCRTREELIERLLSYGLKVIGETINSAGLDTLPPLEALRNLTEKSLKNREITMFLINYWDDEKEAPPEWDQQMDAFFLRGQQAGIFRIDIPAAALSEIWVALLCGLSEAEYRGRIAKAGLADLLERALLQGISHP